MGGSRRRAKKFRTKVSVKGRRKPKTKSRMPADLKQAAEADRQRLGVSGWDDQKTFVANYRDANLIPDANASFGRNFRPDALKVRSTGTFH